LVWKRKGKKGKLKLSGFAAESFLGLRIHREREETGGRGRDKG
jgi:hypothetical protein